MPPVDDYHLQFLLPAEQRGLPRHQSEREAVLETGPHKMHAHTVHLPLGAHSVHC